MHGFKKKKLNQINLCYNSIFISLSESPVYADVQNCNSTDGDSAQVTPHNSFLSLTCL